MRTWKKTRTKKSTHRHTTLILISLAIYTSFYLLQPAIPTSKKYPLPSAIPVSNLDTTFFSTHIFANGSTTIFKQPTFHASPDEVIFVHSPFCLAPPSTSLFSTTVAQTSTQRSVTCTDFSHNITFSQSECSSFLYSSSMSIYGPFAPATIYNSTTYPTGSVTLPFSAIIMNMHARDNNICNLLMRLTFARNIIRRSNQKVYGHALQQVKHLILVVPDRTLHNRLRYLDDGISGDGDGDGFHAGAIRSLFVSAGVHVIVARSLDELIFNHHPGICYRSAAVVGSHENRFSFPDVSMPRVVREGGLEAPLSSDGFEIRKDFFLPRAPPKRRYKMVYITKAIGEGTSFDNESEHRFRLILQQVSREHSIRLLVFDADETENFWTQVRYVCDASVIVGLHGAGLALGLFAPNEGTSLVEIQAEDQKSLLFESLKSHGIHHTIVNLESGSNIRGTGMNVLSDADSRRIRDILVERVQASMPRSN